MTALLAWRNLLHDPLRFAATLIGIIFSVTLMGVQMGLLQGFSNTASGLVDHAGADIWIVSKGTLNVDQSAILNERSLYKALSNPGIADFSRLVVRYLQWRKPSGATELVIVVGVDPRTGMGAPWSIYQGTLETLIEPNAVMIDTLYAAKLGVTRLGQEVEIANRKARVAGLTDGIRTFTQSPYVFTSYNNAVRFSEVLDGNASYILIKVAPGTSRQTLIDQIKADVPNVDVLTGEDFSARTRRYWIYTTGAGTSLMFGAVLGAIVGIVIVAQTLYAATVERISEYATLSAMGAGHGYLNRIVITQALICGAIGSAVGVVIVAVLQGQSVRSPAVMMLSVNSTAVIVAAAIGMCVLSSVLAIRKLMRIDPTSVFK